LAGLESGKEKCKIENHYVIGQNIIEMEYAKYAMKPIKDLRAI